MLSFGEGACSWFGYWVWCCAATGVLVPKWLCVGVCVCSGGHGGQEILELKGLTHQPLIVNPLDSCRCYCCCCCFCYCRGRCAHHADIVACVRAKPRRRQVRVQRTHKRSLTCATRRPSRPWAASERAAPRCTRRSCGR